MYRENEPWLSFVFYFTQTAALFVWSLFNPVPIRLSCEYAMIIQLLTVIFFISVNFGQAFGAGCNTDDIDVHVSPLTSLLYLEHDGVCISSAGLLYSKSWTWYAQMVPLCGITHFYRVAGCWIC